MTEYGNVKIFTEDEEIIEELQSLPSMAEYENMNVLSFIQNRTVGYNFGTVIGFKDMVFTIYKFDKELHAPDDAGLLMTKSKKIYADEHILIWQNFRTVGMSFNSKIYNTFNEILMSTYATSRF